VASRNGAGTSGARPIQRAILGPDGRSTNRSPRTNATRPATWRTGVISGWKASWKSVMAATEATRAIRLARSKTATTA
jgi:hypothetical protein